MNNFYLIELIDLRFQVDHKYSQKSQLFREYKGESPKIQRDDRIFALLIKNGEIKMISDGKKSTQYKVI